MKLRAATLADAAAIAEIYEPFVAASTISFETEAPDEAAMAARIAAAGDRYPWLVALDEEDRVRGYAYAAAFRTRAAYRFAVETSIYLTPARQGRGAGKQLYGALMETLIGQGYTQAVAAIALPNEASIRLHEQLGFTRAGIYREIGYKQGAWHDVGLWQRPLAPATVPPREPLALASLAQWR